MKQSKRSLFVALCALVAYTALILIMVNADNNTEENLWIAYAVILMPYVLTFLGCLFTFLAFIQSEPSSWYKWLGAFLNLILVLMFLITFVVIFRGIIRLLN